MYRVIKIGAKDVPMLANGATPYRYKQIFRADYFKDMTSDTDVAEKVETLIRLGFVMAMQAEKRDMAKVNEDMFIEWLESLDLSALLSSTNEILALQNGNEETGSDPKSEAAEQIDLSQ